MLDTHAHLCHEKLFLESETIIQRAQEIGVSKILNICLSHKELEEGKKIKQKHPACIYLAAAIHPQEVSMEGVEDYFVAIERAIKDRDIVVIGETGLDYFREFPDRNKQQEIFSRHIALAKEYAFPIAIHCRHAFKDLFSLLKRENHLSGVVHCFTGSIEEAKEVLDHGFYLSLSGIVTFKKSVVLQEVARYIPLDRLLLETDAPYLAPEPYRGKINEPAFIEKTYAYVAEIKKISFEDLKRIVRKNGSWIFQS